MNDDPRYAAINEPAHVYPAVTAVDVLRAYKRIARHFGAAKYFPVGVLEGRGGRPFVSGYRTARRCWISRKPTTGHLRGWGRMIHDASHFIFAARHPNARAHDGGHATLEREITEWARAHLVNKFELATLRAKAKPTVEDKLAKLDAAILRWDSKMARADRAARKLRIKRRRLAKTVKSDTLAPTV